MSTSAAVTKPTDSLDSLFSQYDKNNDGSITKEELEDVLRKSKLPFTNEQVERLVQKLDKNQDGKITIDEFKKFVTDRRTKLRKTFEEFDTNKDGKLTTAEVFETFQRQAENSAITQQQVDQMMKRIDKDGDGSVSFEEWTELLQMAPRSNLRSIMSYWQEAAVTVDNREGILTVPEKGQTWAISLLSGAIAGTASRTVTAPVERLKTIYQISTGKPPSLAQGFKQMWQEGGFKGLFRGNGINCLKIAPESATRFLVFEQAKDYFERENKKAASKSHGKDGESHHNELSGWQLFASGSISGVVSHTIVFPLEVLKTRLAVATTGQYKGIMDCVSTMIKTEGAVAPFFRGLSVSLMSTIPHAGVSLSTYELFKKVFVKETKDNSSNIGGLMAASTASSLLSQVIFYPLHVVKTRMILGHKHHGHHQQQQPVAKEAGTPVTAPKKVGLVQTFTGIIKNEGPTAFYKGFLPSILKSVPAHCVTYVCYEVLKKALGVQKHSKHGGHK